MSATDEACRVRDWAALISAIAWPSIVAFVLIYFRETLLKVTNAKFLGVELTMLAQNTKTTTEALLERDADFDRIQGLLDWNKVAAEVRNWAEKNKAKDPSDMGINNFRRFLFDTGLPGGKDIKLEREADGWLKYQ